MFKESCLFLNTCISIYYIYCSILVEAVAGWTSKPSFEVAVTWTTERIHIYYQNIKFNNLYVL
jgi:hypothetical protein